jgi:hypothetical protein
MDQMEAWPTCRRTSAQTTIIKRDSVSSGPRACAARRRHRLPAAAEAIIGLLIEVSFIATFT